MAHPFYDIAFTPAVTAEQERRGSRAAYARLSGGGPGQEVLYAQARTFITARDSFYLATVSETGWPYVQHRGGAAGFVKVLDAATLGWAEYPGNRQYISTGNAKADGRCAMIFMDYPNQRRLKALGHLSFHDRAARPELEAMLGMDPWGRAPEHYALVRVEAVDWNCPKYITPRFTEAEITASTAPLRARIAELEAQLAGCISPTPNPKETS